jgi:2-keto-4-pentenoate hydratase
MDRAAVTQAAELLIAARRSGKLLDELPASCKPQTLEGAFAIQDATVAGLGETVAGWKAAIVDGRTVRGAIMGSRVFASPARIPAASMPLLGIEAEIAFRFERDLPAGKYSYEQVADSVTAFAAIEVVDSRFRTYPDLPLMDRHADCVSNGGFVHGPVVADWRQLDLTNIAVALTIGGNEIVRRTGGHATGDPLLPAVALVNDLPNGAKAGQVVTTGTYTGIAFAKPGQTVVASFAGFGAVEVTFI